MIAVRLVSLLFILCTCSGCVSSNAAALSGGRLECRPATSDDLKRLNDPKLAERDLDTIQVVEAKDFSPGEEYAIFGENLKGQAQALAAFIGTEEEISYSLLVTQSNFMKGEPYNLLARNSKTKKAKTLTMTPNPIEASWEDGAFITCMALDSSMELWQLKGKGFKPNERFVRTSESWNEVMSSEDQASETGAFMSLQLPGVIGKTGGINYITIERVETGEKRTLNVPYGSFAFR